MKHYSESEWLTFKHHLIEKPEAERMENHLLTCDHCLNLFLTLTDDVESAVAQTIIPPDFSRHTMAFIHRQQMSRPQIVSGRGKIKRLLSYYVAAAMVTIILMSGGFFETVASSASLISANSINKTERPNSIIFTWPTRLMETSSSWTQLIPKETKNIKEVIW